MKKIIIVVCAPLPHLVLARHCCVKGNKRGREQCPFFLHESRPKHFFISPCSHKHTSMTDPVRVFSVSAREVAPPQRRTTRGRSFVLALAPFLRHVIFFVWLFTFSIADGTLHLHCTSRKLVARKTSRPLSPYPILIGQRLGLVLWLAKARRGGLLRMAAFVFCLSSPCVTHLSKQQK